MRKNLLTILLCCIASIAMADTIHVEQIRMAPLKKLLLPYKTDSLNNKGEIFNVKTLLDKNHALVHQAKTHPLCSVSDCKISTDSNCVALTTLYFTVETETFQKTSVVINKMKNYVLFIDNKQHSGRDIKLLPGRHEFTLLCMAEGSSTDSISIAITGEKATSLQINPTHKKNYDLADVTMGKHFRSVQLSPSGKYLLTHSYEVGIDLKYSNFTLLTETKTGKTIFKQNRYADFKWLPKQDLLYYVQNGANGREVCVYNPATACEEIWAEHIPEGNFIISPTQDYLVFTRTEKGKEPVGGLKRLEEPDDRMPGWRNRQFIELFDLASGITRQITFGNASMHVSDISADGKKLLLSYSTMETERTPFSETTILTYNVEDGAIDTVIQDQPYLADAKFSPDAQQLLVKASPGAFNGIGSELSEGKIANAFDYRLYLYQLSDEKVTPLLKNFTPAVGQYQWRETDGQIYFRASDRHDEALFCLNPQTAKVQRLNLPISYVQGYSISKTGSKRPLIAAYGQTGETSREMYLCELEKTGNLKVLASEKLNPSQSNIGKCQDWDFVNQQADTIRGFYFLPPHFDSTKKYPLIVYYYGGCTPSPKLLEFHYPLQVLASQGYVVYVCQPSGAIGFGQEFAARHVGTWGQGSADDIIQGTQAFLKAHPFVDSSKVGCMGASYGGFMTQYLQTRTDLFAAAISHAGISNIASYWGGGYWGYTYGEIAQQGSFPWNNPDLYVKQSPLFNAHKINTPLLLLHGTVDTNVPTNESQQLFTALRILGKPVSYVQIDGQDHVITEAAKKQQWLHTIFAWFAHWLKNEPAWWTDLYPNDKFGQDK